MNWSEKIREVPDFPQPGILFRDITPLLADGQAYRAAIDELAAFARRHGAQVVVGPEARGFVVGAPLACILGVGFAPVRKRGKLPAATVAVEYALEYGTDVLEIHRDAVQPGQRVVVADDLLATGGTVSATVELVRKLGGVVVAAAFFIELAALGGRRRLDGIPVQTLVTYT
ncbi:MAG: adenine phosphoribosyltransferase [Alicyclobacillus sp.]|nr:adenine phosphoribosyltransferase [Alicyclobacillus sp.]